VVVVIGENISQLLMKIFKRLFVGDNRHIYKNTTSSG
jgi:hypothetical protein